MKGFATSGIAGSAAGKGGASYGWWAGFLHNFVVPNSSWIAKLVALSELAIGALLILGLFTGVAALAGLVLNMIYMFSGTAGVNPPMPCRRAFDHGLAKCRLLRVGPVRPAHGPRPRSWPGPNRGGLPEPNRPLPCPSTRWGTAERSHSVHEICWTRGASLPGRLAPGGLTSASWDKQLTLTRSGTATPLEAIPTPSHVKENHDRHRRPLRPTRASSASSTPTSGRPTTSTAGQIYLMDNPLLQPAARPRGHQAAAARPLGNQPGAQLPLRPPESDHQGPRPRRHLRLRARTRRAGRRRQHLAGGHLQRALSPRRPATATGMAPAVPPVLLPGRHPEPLQPGDPGIDPRGRRAGLLAEPRVRRRLRQSRPGGRLRGRRRRGRDRAGGHRMALEQVPRSATRRRRAARSST